MTPEQKAEQKYPMPPNRDFKGSLLQAYDRIKREINLQRAAYIQGLNDAGGMKWVKASERLPEVISIPYANFRGIAWDRGSKRIFFRYKDEPMVGRYIEEKMSFKNIFVSAEMDRVILSAEFEFIEWLSESTSIDSAANDSQPIRIN